MKHDELLDQLPETLRLIIQLTDIRTALILINNFGGCEYHLPAASAVHERHELAELIGLNNLKKICQYWHNGENIYIPKADKYFRILRDERIAQDFADLGVSPMTQKALAKKYGLTERWVRQMRRRQVQEKQKPIDRQLDMFATL